jgi:hypothetical protein
MIADMGASSVFLNVNSRDGWDVGKLDSLGGGGRGDGNQDEKQSGKYA